MVDIIITALTDNSAMPMAVRREAFSANWWV